MNKPKIGFLGLGAMGEPMCRHVLNAGYEVYSSANRSRDGLERLQLKGLIEKPTSSDVAEESDVLFTIVWDEAQNDGILRGADGALSRLKAGSTVVIMSTVSPQYCVDLADEANKLGIHVLDCPVSGMVSGAEAGSLSMMIGGEDATIDNIRPVLETMGTVMKCGPVGAGQAVKLGNNAISIGSYQLIQEVRDTVRSAGVDLDNFIQILNDSTGRSFVSQTWPMPRQRRGLSAMPEKDISRCLEVARENGIQMPMLEACYDSGTKS